MNIIQLLELTGADTIRCSPVRCKGEIFGYEFVALYTPHYYASTTAGVVEMETITPEQLAERLKNEPQS
jgi:hypothetical protein